MRRNKDITGGKHRVSMMLHCLGFDDCGNGKNYRNYYCLADKTSVPCMEWIYWTELESVGLALQLNDSTFFKLTSSGEDTVLHVVAKGIGKSCCYNCKHLEYVQGEETDPSGFCCNKRQYKESWKEIQHLKMLEKHEYKFGVKRCCDKISRGVE